MTEEQEGQSMVAATGAAKTIPRAGFLISFFLTEHPSSTFSNLELITDPSAYCVQVTGVCSSKDLAQTKVRTLNLRKANFHFLKELDSRIPWETSFRDYGTELGKPEGIFHTVQELSIPWCKKSEKEDKRLAWIIKNLLLKLKSKKEVHRQWRQEHHGKNVEVQPSCVRLGFALILQ